MPDWLRSMQQTYEYYVVDPESWRDTRRLCNVTACNIRRDSNAETLGSATIDMTEDLGESYIRVYLVTVQNGITEKHPLGTFLVQTPSLQTDGKVQTASVDAYTPLLELKESPPPLGYAVLAGENIMESAYMAVREHARAPVVRVSHSERLHTSFVSNLDDTWLSFARDFISNGGYHFGLDEMGRILFQPDQDTTALQPVWTYTDDNSSILQPALTIDRDLYKIPNVVEAIYSTGTEYYVGRAVNSDRGSPTSTVSRGREITHRVTNPEFAGAPAKAQVQAYAEQLLREMSVIEYTVTYTHGYCPVRIGDCVRLCCSRAGIDGVKARVVSQDISCTAGCQVSETAVFTQNMWR